VPDSNAFWKRDIREDWPAFNNMLSMEQVELTAEVLDATSGLISCEMCSTRSVGRVDPPLPAASASSSSEEDSSPAVFVRVVRFCLRDSEDKSFVAMAFSFAFADTEVISPDIESASAHFGTHYYCRRFVLNVG